MRVHQRTRPPGRHMASSRRARRLAPCMPPRVCAWLPLACRARCASSRVQRGQIFAAQAPRGLPSDTPARKLARVGAAISVMSARPCQSSKAISRGCDLRESTRPPYLGVAAPKHSDAPAWERGQVRRREKILLLRLRRTQTFAIALCSQQHRSASTPAAVPPRPLLATHTRQWHIRVASRVCMRRAGTTSKPRTHCEQVVHVEHLHRVF